MGEDIVYLLECIDDGDVYIGCTDNIERRLQQHNGKRSGGAKYTRGKRWRPFCYIGGFRDRRSALQFEWRSKRVCICSGKHCTRGCTKLRRRPGERRVHRKARCLFATMNLARWTKKALPPERATLYVGAFSKEDAAQLEKLRQYIT
jgi:predicted GIY-YIG superfamily endonuclease